MRVRISHSIDLSEVPIKSAEMLVPISKRLGQLENKLFNLIEELRSDDPEFGLIAKGIDRIRMTMSDCDGVLSEVGDFVGSLRENEEQAAAAEKTITEVEQKAETTLNEVKRVAEAMREAPDELD